MSKFDEAIYILIVDLISRKKQFGSSNVNLDEITETVKDNIRTSLNKLYLQQLISVDEKKNITLKQKKWWNILLLIRIVVYLYIK